MNDIFKVVGLIIFAGILSIELGIASAIFEILAGFFAANIFHLSDSDVITILGDFGILTLMYFAGLEIDFDVLKKNMKCSLYIGSASFFTPFITVIIVSIYLLEFSLEQALLAAIALSTTSIALVYPILLKSNNCLDDMGKKILSAAMVVDLLSMISLSLLFSRFTYITIGFILAFAVFSYFVPSLGRRIFSHYKGNIAEFEFKIVMFLILGIGIAGEAMGIESVIIAFIMGTITSGIIVEHVKLWDKLRGITFGFLAPIFFYKVGTTIDLVALIENIWIIILLFSVGFISNFAGTYLSSKRYMGKHARYVSLLFNTQLSFGIVAATVGHELHILTGGMYASIVGAVILSSLLASYLTRNGYTKKSLY